MEARDDDRDNIFDSTMVHEGDGVEDLMTAYAEILACNPFGKHTGAEVAQAHLHHASPLFCVSAPVLHMQAKIRSTWKRLQTRSTPTPPFVQVTPQFISRETRE